MIIYFIHVLPIIIHAFEFHLYSHLWASFSSTWLNSIDTINCIHECGFIHVVNFSCHQFHPKCPSFILVIINFIVKDHFHPYYQLQMCSIHVLQLDCLTLSFISSMWYMSLVEVIFLFHPYCHNPLTYFHPCDLSPIVWNYLLFHPYCKNSMNN